MDTAAVELLGPVLRVERGKLAEDQQMGDHANHVGDGGSGGH